MKKLITLLTLLWVGLTQFTAHAIIYSYGERITSLEQLAVYSGTYAIRNVGATGNGWLYSKSTLFYAGGDGVEAPPLNMPDDHVFYFNYDSEKETYELIRTAWGKDLPVGEATTPGAAVESGEAEILISQSPNAEAGMFTIQSATTGLYYVIAPEGPNEPKQLVAGEDPTDPLAIWEIYPVNNMPKIETSVPFPFELSVVRRNKWHEGAQHWYTLQTSDAYWIYNAETGGVDVKEGVIDAPINDAALWCITFDKVETFGTDESVASYHIYNKAAGPSLTLDLPRSSSVYATLSTTFRSLIIAYYTSGYEGWGISPLYYAPLGEEPLFTNKLSDEDKLGVWGNKNGGPPDERSVVEFTDLKTAYANLVESYKERINEDNCVGGYSQEVFDASGLASATTPEEYAEAFTYLNEHTTRLADDGLYRIKCAPLRGSYNLSFDADAARLDVGTANTTSASQIWKITQTTDGKYALTSQGKGLGGGDLGKVDQVVPITDASEATTFYVRRGLAEGTLGKEGLLWSFDHTFDCISNWEYHSTALNLTADNDVTYMQNYHPSSVWYIIPATSLDLTVGAAGYATLNLPFAVALPKEVSAYGIANETADAIVLNKLALNDGVLPANTPVLIAANSGTYALTLLPDNTDEAIETGFEGTLLSEEIADDVNAYILSQKEGDATAKFYALAQQQEGSNSVRTLPENKAYYVSPLAGAAFSLKLDNTPTGIDNTTIHPQSNGQLYDLNGRPVLYPTTGVYIQNGKTVFIKK